MILGTPVGVGEGCDGGSGKWEFDEGRKGVIAATVEGDAEILGAFEIADDALGGVEMSTGGAMIVLCKEVGDGSDVGACGCGEPLEAAGDLLELGVVALLSGRIARGDGNLVDREAGAIGRWSNGNVGTIEAGAGDEGVGEGFLSKVDGDVAIVVADGLESDAEEVGDVAVEGGFDVGAEFLFEFAFNLVGFGEVDKVVNI